MRIINSGLPVQNEKRQLASEPAAAGAESLPAKRVPRCRGRQGAPPILSCVTYYEVTAACQRRLPWTLKRSRV
ncbi:protein of unknown function [Paraburkholderia dioscoreae]|uniref:Uncharacterized protein n=1 Tax=Paraburkholderia dioscoreae TaxID=2604047 RepID=A0A5Q4Z2C8_9BURK|nr:protein of unknown function [Paraburkholderia dioscoreae]